MTQMTQEAKSLWRIKKNYLKESKSPELKKFWSKLAQDKAEHLKDLKVLIKKELK